MIDLKTVTANKKKPLKPTQKHRQDETNKHTTYITLTILLGALLRFLVALSPYSGHSKPPMFGDYEAQRHWMEITVNLPSDEWYRNTSSNDLQYWGLDYPPLTAYHSWLTGKVAQTINKSYVELWTSRGIESIDHKNFMRWTVFVADFTVFFPSVLYFFTVLFRKEPNLSPGWLPLTLIYPGFILIDHGHFQYNCISLGFTVAAISFLLGNSILYSALFFTLALNYKQMSLYHALPFFVYMLRLCIDQKTFIKQVTLLIKLSLIVLTTFAIVWSPFLLKGSSALDVLHRIFPVARGIFEDKVANVWCAVNVVYKLRNLPLHWLVRMCAVATLTFSVPSLMSLFMRPSHRQFLLSLINVSLAFFLFSFQVHEKSILLVSLPVLLYAPYDPLPCAWFLIMSVVSLFHLAVKDNLLIPFFALSILFCVFIWHNEAIRRIKNRKILLLLGLSLVGSLVIFCGFLLVKPPDRLPDLWPLLNAIYSASHFVLFFMYFNWRQLF